MRNTWIVQFDDTKNEILHGYLQPWGRRRLGLFASYYMLSDTFYKLLHDACMTTRMLHCIQQNVSIPHSKSECSGQFSNFTKFSTHVSYYYAQSKIKYADNLFTTQILLSDPFMLNMSGTLIGKNRKFPRQHFGTFDEAALSRYTFRSKK